MNNIILKQQAIDSIATNPITEAIFEFGYLLKQRRATRFIELFLELFESNGDVYMQKIQTEEFTDLFDNIIRKSLKTSSEKKILLFRDILFNQVINPIETEKNTIYSELVDQLTEKEFEILHQVFIHVEEHNKLLSEKSELESLIQSYNQNINKEKQYQSLGQANQYEYIRLELAKSEGRYNVILENLIGYDNLFCGERFGVTEGQFTFYKQSLITKGLVYDYGIGRRDYNPLRLIAITDFGKEFLDFVAKIEC